MSNKIKKEESQNSAEQTTSWLGIKHVPSKTSALSVGDVYVNSHWLLWLPEMG